MATTVKMPRLGLDENENVLGEWFVSEGDAVSKGDELFSIETDKSSMTVYAEESGFVLKQLYEAFDIVPVLAPVCVIGAQGEDISNLQLSVEPSPSQTDEAPIDAPVAEETAPFSSARVSTVEAASTVFSPRAKVLAEANGIVLEQAVATGAENRILEEDVLRAMDNQISSIDSTPIKKPPVPSQVKTETPVKISNMRRVIAKNMMNSMLGSAQTTSHMRYNASKIQAYRKWLKSSPGAEKTVTINDLIVYATIKTLKELPYMNAHMVNDEEMILFNEVNIGCAVDTDKGLMVPTVKHADKMTLAELSSALKNVAQKCKDGTITKDEMSDATFTLTNVGTSGVTYFTPIINPPQIGILGIGTIDYAIKMTDEGVLYYPAGYLSLTYDHRAVDGAPTAQFLKAVCHNLENFDQLI